MAKEEIIIGLDIGSSKIRICVGQVKIPESKLHIIGVGEAPSSGIRRGIIVDVEEACSSISAACEEAERTSGVPCESAYVSIGGSHIVSQKSKGVIAVSRADNEITEHDVSRVIEAASAVSVPPNHEILHVIPQNFIVDNLEGVKDPVGMNGIRLEAETLVIEGATSFIKNLAKCLNRVGIEIDDLVVNVIAASEAVLSKKQKELGVVLVDIGGGTTSLACFEEGDVIHMAILPCGSEHITNDLAIGLRTSIDTAEAIKKEFGSCLPKEIDKREEIDLSKFEADEQGVSRRKIAEIIEARLSEIFSMVDKELKKIGRSGKLPCGAVLVGGGVKVPGIVDLAKKELKLPTQIGFPENLPGLTDKVDDPSFATCEGLIIWGLNQRKQERGFGAVTPLGETVKKVKFWIRKFLP